MKYNNSCITSKMKFSIIYSGKVELPEFEPILGSEKTVLQKQNGIFFSNSRWLTEAEIGSTEDLREKCTWFSHTEMWDKILDINKCHLQEDPSNAIRNEVRDFANANGRLSSTQGFEGLRTLMLRTSSTGENHGFDPVF
jgi:23S rRNA (uracil1939-C5)-methyltransferase